MALKLSPRKLVRINKSLLVSLPKLWLDSQGLTKGDSVSIIVQKNGIIKIKRSGNEEDTC